ncbi:MAG: urease accessory protein UreD [Paracoccaceae bacterium]
MQRSKGAAMASFRLQGGRTRLADLHQSGSGKIMFPRVDGPVPEAVFLNTSGGLTGGDRLNYTLEIGEGCRVLATTQTAERGYASLGTPAEIRMTAKVGTNARLDWLPQETILFEHANLQRQTEIDLAPGAECLLAETVVLGRHAMGETLISADLHDHRMIRRQGRPIWAETFQLNAAVLAAKSAALLGDARAMAVVCLIAQGAEDAVGPVRAVLDDSAAASGWDGKCVVRLMANDGWPLKQQLARILQVLAGRKLPKVWQSGENT